MIIVDGTTPAEVVASIELAAKYSHLYEIQFTDRAKEISIAHDLCLVSLGEMCSCSRHPDMPGRKVQ